MPEAPHHAAKLQQRLAEAFDSLWDGFVDPREALAGEDGGAWLPVAGAWGRAGAQPLPGDETQLAALRDECRLLCLTNEFAANAIENRISYVIGPGHVYRATVRKGLEADGSVAAAAQRVLDEFLRRSRWHSRQQELLRRLDRDGEAFLRFFADGQGRTHVRAIEPDQVVTPPHAANNPDARLGVVNRPGDAEGITGYWVDGRLVAESEVQHRKANVDRNVRRGLPLFTPVRNNLRRAEKLLRNMSVVAEVQSAIALIRKHRGAARSTVEAFVDAQADRAAADAAGRPRRVSQYGPGAILDAPAGLEYDFPSTGVNAASFVAVLQAELRAIAARLVMPEFMFTSDASNGSYASTMVAEGPAIRLFERLQAAVIEDDAEVMRRVLSNASQAGALPADVLEQVEVQITAPPLASRDRLREAQADRIAHESGVLSAQTWSQRLGLDYDQEQKNRQMCDSAAGD